MRLSLAAARKYALIICMHLLAVISMRLLTVLYLLFIESTASLSDKDAVYLIESVVGGLHICKRVRSPTVCEGLQLNTRRQKRWPFCCVPSGAGPSRLFFGRLAGHPG